MVLARGTLGLHLAMQIILQTKEVSAPFSESLSDIIGKVNRSGKAPELYKTATVPNCRESSTQPLEKRVAPYQSS